MTSLSLDGVKPYYSYPPQSGHEDPLLRVSPPSAHAEGYDINRHFRKNE
jgi:hypothetical protein